MALLLNRLSLEEFCRPEPHSWSLTACDLGDLPAARASILAAGLRTAMEIHEPLYAAIDRAAARD
jgi:hypothetical protein